MTITANHHPSSQNCPTCLLSEVERLKREVETWKNAHDGLIELARVVREREL